MGRVWVVGSCNVDRGWRVDRHPAVGETVLGTVGGTTAGGKGLNQAVAACRAGAEVVLVGAVGDDDDGRRLRGLAAAEGIDVTRVAVVEGVSTGTALVVVAADGSNTVTVDPGANAHLVVGDLPIEPGDVVVAQLEVPPTAVAAAFGAARAVGARTVLNPSPAGAEGPLLDLADVLVVNEPEAAGLARAEGAPPAGAAAARDLATALAAGRHAAVVTLGAAGAVAAGPAAPHGVAVPGREVEAVDTTGAGDCFLGVLAATLAGGRSLPAALERANRAAALSVTRAGAAASMPTAVELDGPGGAAVSGAS